MATAGDLAREIAGPRSTGSASVVLRIVSPSGSALFPVAAVGTFDVVRRSPLRRGKLRIWRANSRHLPRPTRGPVRGRGAIQPARAQVTQKETSNRM
jgi:hypothetical protein